MYATERCRSLTLPGGRSSTSNLLRVLTNLSEKSIGQVPFSLLYAFTFSFLDLVPNIQSQPAEMYATERCRSLTLPGGRSSTLNLLRVLTNLSEKSIGQVPF